MLQDHKIATNCLEGKLDFFPQTNKKEIHLGSFTEIIQHPLSNTSQYFRGTTVLDSQKKQPHFRTLSIPICYMQSPAELDIRLKYQNHTNDVALFFKMFDNSATSRGGL